MVTQHRLWMCAVMTAVAVTAFTVPRYGVPHIGAGFNPSSVTVPVGQRLEQLIAVRAWGLHTLTVHVSDVVSAASLEVEVEHRENGVPLTVARTTIAVTAAGAVPVRFAPAQSGPNAEFMLRLRPNSADRTGAVTFQATEGHEYREGRLWLEGVELPLDLVLETDALASRPWPAFAGLLHRRTGVHGLEWVFAIAYVGGVCAVVRFAASLQAA
jgi:hypothetical protein